MAITPFSPVGIIVLSMDDIAGCTDAGVHDGCYHDY